MGKSERFLPNVVEIPERGLDATSSLWFQRLPVPIRRFTYTGISLIGLTSAACFGGSEDNGVVDNQPGVGGSVATTEKPRTFDYILPLRNKLDPSKPVFYTSGPHPSVIGDTGPRDGIDLAGLIPEKCLGGQPSKEVIVIASASGKVMVVGKEDKTDPNHSIVEIQHPDGLTTGYMHLANIKVSVGQEVRQGDELGNPSCELQPGGNSTGVHLHLYVEKDGKKIPIDGYSFSGWVFKAGGKVYDGTAIGEGGVQREANPGRCFTDGACGGVRNDLTVSGASGTNETERATVKPSELKFAKIGELAPDFELKNLDGKTIRLSDYRGRPVVIIIWQDHAAHYSTPAVDRIVSVKNELGAADLVVLALVNKDFSGSRKLKASVNEVLLDEEQSFFNQYPTTVVPTTYMIDSRGFLVRTWGGVGNRTKFGVNRDIQDLVAKRPLFESPKLEGDLKYRFPAYLVDFDVLRASVPFIFADANLASQIVRLLQPGTGSVEERIGDIIRDANRAGELVSAEYCRNPTQKTFDFMSGLALDTTSKVRFYISEGLLPHGTWQQTLRSFTPGCAVTHIPS